MVISMGHFIDHFHRKYFPYDKSIMKVVMVTLTLHFPLVSQITSVVDIVYVRQIDEISKYINLVE